MQEGWEDKTYLGFCCWRGRPAKDVSRRVLAREAALLGGWLSDGLCNTLGVKHAFNLDIA